MPIYQRILLVLVLAIGMIAAGVAWERFCVAPLVEQALRKPDPPDFDADDLPPECLEELATMGMPATATDPRSEKPWGATKAALNGPSPLGDNILRPSGGSNQATTHIQVTDSSPVPATLEHDAAARPIQHAQSAEWVEPAAHTTADPRVGRRSQAGALPASAEESMRQNDRRDTLKSVDVLDLMRRLRAEDGDQRAEGRRELVRRGFSEVDLELARQLFSPDADTRKQLARAVPRLSSVDAAQWLMWLALDPQPEVRLAAVTTLATTGDPALLDRVEALARSDRDPQIQALAEQIAKQRDLSSSRGDSTESAGRANLIR
ncbi:MAG: HEAT repeat domain-containing protein [Thermoguttaceae bacterium]